MNTSETHSQENGKKVPRTHVLKTPNIDQEKRKQRNPYCRAANEDDDGYDPWSDRQASNPLWEKDPWK